MPRDIGGAGDDLGTGTNAAVSRVLTIGACVALALVAAGLALGLLHPVSREQPATPFALLPATIIRGDPVALASLGLLVLLATPAARVIALGIAYAQRREWLFSVIAALVLVVLAASLVIGLSR